MTDDTPDDVQTRIASLEADFTGLLNQHQRALERISDLEDELQAYQDDRERLIFRVGKLEECLPDEADEYDSYTREDKVSLVKSHLLERAYARDGKAAADYDDVIWGVFDGEPSRDHAYTLMELAAQAEGFHYNTSRRPREVRVDLDETKANPDLSHATTNEQRGGD